MRPATVAKLVVGGFVGVIALMTITGSFYTVNQTERAVVLRNGAYVGISEPGIHWKTPWIDSIRTLPVTPRTVTWSGDSKLETYSKDQQSTDIALSVTYHIPENKIGEFYATYVSPDQFVNVRLHPRVLDNFKNVFGQYDAVTSIQDRAKLVAQISDTLIKDMNSGPVIIDSVQILDIKFSPEYEKSVEQRMTAQVEVQKLQQNLEREKVQAEIALTQATGKANSVRAAADADAYATRTNGLADAAAIKAKGDALRDNPGLVTLTTAEKWDGKLPDTMVPGSAVPFISVGKQTNGN